MTLCVAWLGKISIFTVFSSCNRTQSIFKLSVNLWIKTFIVDNFPSRLFREKTVAREIEGYVNVEGTRVGHYKAANKTSRWKTSQRRPQSHPPTNTNQIGGCN